MNPVDGIYAVRDVLRRPLRIESIEGVVVVTREKDPEDHIVSLGKGITIRPKGLLAIRGLTEGAAAKVTGGRCGPAGAMIRL